MIRGEVPDSCSLNSSNLSIEYENGEDNDEEKEENESTITSEIAFVQDVKIIPAKLQFTNTFEGKLFKPTILIQNCGSRTALIRYDGPTNKDFSFKPLKRGKSLPSGMKLTINISYKYIQHSALSWYSIPIFINEEMFPLKVFVSAPIAKVSVDPTHLDFGLVDIGYHVSRRSIKLRNTGSKLSRFSIAIKSHNIQISVEPIKGVLQPYSEITINVEVSSFEEGDFEEYFIIHCVRKIRVSVIGTVMVGKLEICNLPSCDDFTLIEFPKTYYGTKCTQRLVIKNNSASRTVFCVLFDRDEEPGEKVKNSQIFSVSPIDGRLEPREARIFTIEYKPKWINNGESYDFAAVTIKKLNFWKDMNLNDYPKGLYKTLREYKRPEMIRKRNLNSTNSLNISTNESIIHTHSFSYDKSIYSYSTFQDLLTDQPFMELEYRIKLCLHGESEKVDVTCYPNEISIPNLLINMPVNRVITIKNNSHCLSIKFVYEKVAYINTLPKSGTLQPNSSIDVQVIINVCKLGTIFTNILLILFYNNFSIGIDETVQVGKINIPLTLEANFPPKKQLVKINTGITPTYIKEVGFNVDMVTYNKREIGIPRQIMDSLKRKERKNDTTFIAFPNDRPKGLRPYTLKSNTMTTIYAKIPRGIVSSNSLSNMKNELSVREQNRQYYSNYLKHSRMDLMTALNSDSLPEYEITKIRTVLIHRYFADLIGDKRLLKPKVGVHDAFIPFTPLQLNMIKVEPVYISVGLVAPYSKISKSFEITNQNDVSIRVYMIPEKQRFTFPEGEGIIVKANSMKKVDFTFYSEHEGTHSLCIHLVINECHIFEMTVYANVIHKKLIILDQNLTFKANDVLPYKFINLFNPLNVPIDYVWVASESNFVIEPAEGKIPPSKGMASMVTYDPMRKKSNSAVLTFQTTPVHTQCCSISAVQPMINTSLCEANINFGMVPMNTKMTKKAVLLNLSNCTIYFSLTMPKFMNGIQIIPENGDIKSNKSQIFTIKLKSLDCVSFTYKIMININEKPTHEMKIHGNVIFPAVKYSPNPYKLKRIPVTSFTKFCINIENKTKAPIILAFDFGQYMNCTIGDCIDKDGDQYIRAKFTLEAHQVKQLCVRLDPKHVTSLWFNIPFVLNNIIGPPIGPLAVASKSITYIKDPNYTITPSIPIMRVFTIISESDFHVSKYDFDFFYHPYDIRRNNCDDNITFTNTSEKELKFCLRLETVYLPFEITYKSGNEVLKHHNPYSSITFTLPPGEHTTLAITFVPTVIGSFFNTAALYVRDDYQDDVHNYLRLHGVYELPTLCTPELIYFEYIPLKFKYTKIFFIHAKNHSPECMVQAQYESQNLQVFVREEYRTETVHKYEITLVYSSFFSESFHIKIIFTCNCNGCAEVTCIGVSENSLFTTFKVIRNTNDRIIISQTQSKQSDGSIFDESVSHMAANDLNTFPYFPEVGDDDYEILVDTIHVVESWMFCQGFSGKLRFKIPESFSMLTPMPENDDPRKSIIGKLRYVIPYMKFLNHIASTSISDKIGTIVSSNSEEELAHEVLCLYKRVLILLKEHNAHFPHIEPELLLDYEQYVTYITRIKNDRTKLAKMPSFHSRYNFYLLSKQAWLDVILQTLKIFIVGRIKVPNDSNQLLKFWLRPNIAWANEPRTSMMSDHSYKEASRRLSQKSDQLSNKSDNKMFMGHHMLSQNEYYLLNWIKHYYRNYIGVICQEKLEVMIEKQIDDYDSCFMDSLVLATVIVAHCPYLKHGLSGLYWIPSSSEQLHHNAAVVIQALLEINSTFELLPRNIYNPNNIQMILLVTYLYQFLPYMSPSSIINVTSKLSKTSIIKISITNDNTFEVYYKVLFFENEHKCFSEARSIVMVKAKSTEYLDIRFQAKYIREVTAILILCGEVVGKRCAKSITYKLVGEPDITHVSSSFNICGKYYSTEEHALNVQAPYKVSGCYDIFLTYTQPTCYKELSLIDYGSVIEDRILYKFNFSASQVFFNDQGQSTLFVNSVSLTGQTRGGWFFLRNAQIGDFCIYVEMQTVHTRQVEFIHVTIPKKIYNHKCVCAEKGPMQCKKYVMIKVPKTNNLLLECFKRVFIKLKGDKEEFWNLYLEKPAALRCIENSVSKEHRGNIKLLIRLLMEDKQFDVAVQGLGLNSKNNQNVTFPETLTITKIEYGNLESFTPFYIHVADCPIRNFHLHLYCKKFAEFRKYKVIVSHYNK